MSPMYLNGSIVDSDKACISVFDRGFLFGDSIYEVIPVYQGKAFMVDDHLQRLNRSLQAIDMQNPMTDAAWKQAFDELLTSHDSQQEVYLYLQVSRGVAVKRDHGYSRELSPTIVILLHPVKYPVFDINSPGVKAITLDDNRWSDCHIKSTNLLPNVLLRQKSLDQDGTEAILIRDGEVTEGAASNVFIVKDELIRTPPLSRLILGGITRQLVLKLCASNHIIAQEKPISEDELHDADEIWVASSTKEIVAVTTLNQHKVGQGVPGPMWKKLMQLYQALKQQQIT